ncbi:PREDICTED: uncharacterized protein LOC104778977 [Camelina sativa]|uniref:Uncharacterized protein LOC104778977 n=1 Tax=Camelina sativa TaxID=90675 RepID=A0ABM1R9R0_CAMSA|nr:PREDICTED: uncharacterized protein LOC104778977 [Camelina sativa]
MADKFPCERCKANLSFKNSTEETARCCNISRPVQNNLVMLVCGGCQAKVIHQRGDKTVKCSDCQHINITTVGRTYGVRPPNQGPPQFSRFVRPQVNLIDCPQGTQVVPPHVNLLLPPHVNVLVPPQDNRDHLPAYRFLPVQVNKDFPLVYRLVPDHRLNQGPPQVNRVVPQQVNRVVPQQVSRVAPQQVSQVTQQVSQVTQQVNRVVPPRVNQDPLQVYQVALQHVNQVVPQQVNRAVPPRVYGRRNRVETAETESTASSPFTVSKNVKRYFSLSLLKCTNNKMLLLLLQPKPEITVVEYPDNAVAESVIISSTSH